MIKLAKDKQKHFLVGLLLSATIPFIGVYGLILCLGAGIGKEVYDLVSKRGTPEIMDAVWTVFPGAVVFLLYLLFGYWERSYSL